MQRQQKWRTALGLLVCLRSGPGDAKPRFVRLSLNADGAVGVAWSTLSGPSEASVRYGTNPRSLSRRVSGRVGPWLSRALGRTSEATLYDLRPQTRYYYRVGGPKGGFSEVAHFRTPARRDDRCGALRVAFVGDSRAERWQKTRGGAVTWTLRALRIAARRPHLVVHGGDMVYDARSHTLWKHFLWHSEALTRHVPFLPCIGNHDDGPGQGSRATFNRLFHLPHSDKALGGSGTEDFYAFRAANALFAVLSTETFRHGSPPLLQQSRWLDAVLQRNRAVRWKIVILHRPIYTHPMWASHPPDEVGQNQALVPVINRHQVDLVIAGHNHLYERFARSRCEDETSTQPCPVPAGKGGTVYLTSGGGGSFPIFRAGPTNTGRVAAAGVYHFLLIDIHDGRLTTRAIDDKDRVIDRFVLDKELTALDRRCGGALGP